MPGRIPAGGGTYFGGNAGAKDRGPGVPVSASTRPSSSLRGSAEVEVDRSRLPSAWAPSKPARSERSPASSAAPASRSAARASGWKAEPEQPDYASRGSLWDLRRADFTGTMSLPRHDYEAANALPVFAEKYRKSTGDAQLTPAELKLVKTSVSLIKKGAHDGHLTDARAALDVLVSSGTRRGADVKELARLLRTLG